MRLLRKEPSGPGRRLTVYLDRETEAMIEEWRSVQRPAMAMGVAIKTLCWAGHDALAKLERGAGPR